MHQTWRHFCQSPNATHHCSYTIRVATCSLYQHWDHDRVGSTTKSSKPVGLLWPLYKTHYDILTTTLLSYMNSCRKPLKRLRCSPCQRLKDRRGTTIEKLMPFHWNQVTWSWLKLMPTGEQNVKGLVGAGTIQSGEPNWGRHPFLSCEKPVDQTLTSPSLKLTFSHCSHGWDSSLYSCAGQAGQVHHHHARGTDSEEWDWGSTTKCELSVTDPASDKWDSSGEGK